MQKKKVVRFELIALAAVVLLLLYRVAEGPPPPNGFIVFTDIEPNELYHAAFVLDVPDSLAVTATGSFEGSNTTSALGAYAWLLRRGDRAVVWQMTRQNATRSRGTLARVASTVKLDPGTYDLYYTTYGNANSRQGGGSSFFSRNGEGRSWQNDRESWQLVVRTLHEDGSAPYLVARENENERGPGGEGLVWSSAPMQDGDKKDQLFEVKRPTRLHLYGIGEFDNHPMDYGWIERVSTGTNVWEMTLENTDLAGGWDVNRVFNGSIDLAPGIYRAVYETDPGHAYDDWYGNPPLDPAGWGLSLYRTTDATDDVTVFDPWSSRQPFVSLTRVRDSEIHSAQFSVQSPVRVLAYALGEIGSNPYDYAWIVNSETQQKVWEMTRERSHPAGGDDSNREEFAFLTLQPGVYTVYFQTDGSHAYGDWRNGEPRHSERWGVTLFALDTAASQDAIKVISTSHETRPDDEMPSPPTPPSIPAPAAPAPPATPAAPPLGTGEVLLSKTGLGNETAFLQDLTLTETSRLHIYALGEISLGGRYDYGWIDRKDTGETMWEMTFENTVPGGGDDRNRLFDGIVTLPAGDYVVNFKTDFSHAFGDFGERAPNNPDKWGITIEKL